jgi:hypothetical protein
MAALVPVLAMAAPPPPVSIKLGKRTAHAMPIRQGFTHTGGGNIDVQQPTPDTIVVTLTGVAVAGGHPVKESIAQLTYDICQDIEISFDDPKVKKAKLTMEGRVIGLLRSHKRGGLAAVHAACASVNADDKSLISFCVEERAVRDGDNLSINYKEGPCSVSVLPGVLSLHQKLCISATHPQRLFPCKPASAEFAPDPALDPLWISYWEPFHGAAKKDFGFQVTLTLSDDTNGEVEEKKEAVPAKPATLPKSVSVRP